jgi:hypothetical protein
MAPPATSVDLKAAKKGRKSSSSKDERKHDSGKHEGHAAIADEASIQDEKMMRWAMEDERFAPVRTDPRFRPMRRNDAKVGLDSRFSSVIRLKRIYNF